ncbi:hypothetical protein BESB_018030 [Besnoitia besnoiti]|uniref:Sulfurtransferase n=1 Tax=Besnoitia besnoiti TaxID=94643 RepID=A0A2A9M3E8_BESBE|nr:hypothetical protein BESB_018030 [Besnoitia besnoiti]PFH32485.1 hypothetical protein BESB_018030 [Besnoitia besnoiti]
MATHDYAPGFVSPVVTPAELAEVLLRFGSPTQKTQLAQAMRTRTAGKDAQNADVDGKCKEESVAEGEASLSRQPEATSRLNFLALGEETQGRRVFLFDASWTLLPIFGGRDSLREYREGARLPHAVFFDVEECSDIASPYPHMVPSAVLFARYLEAKTREYLARASTGGSSWDTSHASSTAAEKKEGAVVDIHSDVFVVYDGVGVFSAPRAYFMLKAFGCKHAFVLDGGIKRWRAEGFPVELGPLSADLSAAGNEDSWGSTSLGGNAPETAAARHEATVKRETEDQDVRPTLPASPVNEKANAMVASSVEACAQAVAAAARGDVDAANDASERATEAAFDAGSLRKEGLLKVALDSDRVVEYEDVVALVAGARGTVRTPEEGGVGVVFPLLVDARLAGRFNGVQPEPRPCTPSGHMPGAINLPFTDVLLSRQFYTSPKGRVLATHDQLSPFATAPTAEAFACHVLKSRVELIEALHPVLGKLGDDAYLPSRRDEPSNGEETRKQIQLIVTCGSGMTACIIYVALVQVGVDPRCVALYDGSWTEYAERRLLEERGRGICPSLSAEDAENWRRKILQARLAGEPAGAFHVVPGESISEAVA